MEVAFLGNNNCDKWRQLHIPVFEGEDTVGWIGKAEHYFRREGLKNKK